MGVEHIDLEELKKAREQLNKELGIVTPDKPVKRKKVREENTQSENQSEAKSENDANVNHSDDFANDNNKSVNGSLGQNSEGDDWNDLDIHIKDETVKNSDNSGDSISKKTDTKSQKKKEFNDNNDIDSVIDAIIAGSKNSEEGETDGARYGEKNDTVSSEYVVKHGTDEARYAEKNETNSSEYVVKRVTDKTNDDATEEIYEIKDISGYDYDSASDLINDLYSVGNGDKSEKEKFASSVKIEPEKNKSPLKNAKSIDDLLANISSEDDLMSIDFDSLFANKDEAKPETNNVSTQGKEESQSNKSGVSENYENTSDLINDLYSVGNGEDSEKYEEYSSEMQSRPGGIGVRTSFVRSENKVSNKTQSSVEKIDNNPQKPTKETSFVQNPGEKALNVDKKYNADAVVNSRKLVFDSSQGKVKVNFASGLDENEEVDELLDAQESQSDENIIEAETELNKKLDNEQAIADYENFVRSEEDQKTKKIADNPNKEYLKKIENFKFIDIIKSKAFMNSDELSCIYGVDEDKNVICQNFKDFYNTAIFTENDEDVFALFSSMIMSLSLKNSRYSFKFVICDSKNGSSFEIFNNLSYMFYDKISTSNSEIIDSLSGIMKEIDKRYENLAKVGVKNIEEFNNLMKKENIIPMSYLVLFFNNYSRAIHIDDSERINTILNYILKYGRLVGIYVNLVSMDDNIKDNVNFNLQTRIAFMTDMEQTSINEIGMAGAEKIGYAGEYVFKTLYNDDLIHLKVPEISSREVELLIKNIENN